MSEIAEEGDASNELDLVAAQAATGDAESLDRLLRLIDQHQLSRPAIRRLVVNDSDAADVAQEVLVRVSTSIGSYRGEAKFTTWLYTVARNCAISHLRRQRPDDHTEFIDSATEALMASAPRMSSIVANRSDVHQAIESLPSPYREAVVLRDLEGLSYQAIADQTGTELNTVRSRISRGRAMMAASFGDRPQ